VSNSFDGKVFGAEMAVVVKQVIADALLPIRERLAILESRPWPKYLGTFKAGKSYSEASMVSHDGSMWIALKSTTDTPGKSGDWQMSAKSGER
jgi:hypothetical protein